MWSGLHLCQVQIVELDLGGGGGWEREQNVNHMNTCFDLLQVFFQIDKLINKGK